jgi:hypothetical protein
MKDTNEEVAKLITFTAIVITATVTVTIKIAKLTGSFTITTIAITEPRSCQRKVTASI